MRIWFHGVSTLRRSGSVNGNSTERMVPRPGLRVNAAFASQPGHAFLNAEQAQSLHLPDIKTLPVILDDQHQAIGRCSTRMRTVVAWE